MAVFRVEKNNGYTVISNHHLRNKELSLKAKGLLSQMLSLPEDWDYTLRGLSYINRESIDAIRTAVWELEKAGYIVRRQGRDEKGKMIAIEYVIFEQPQLPGPGSPAWDEPVLENPTPENPTSDNPTPENPIPENPTPENPTPDIPTTASPTTENPVPDNPMQINKEIQNKEIRTKEVSTKDVFVNDDTGIYSLPIPSSEETDGSEYQSERIRTEYTDMDAIEVYGEVIKENIEYQNLCQDPSINRQQLDEIVMLIQETVCSNRKMIRIAGNDYPAVYVKSRFIKLDSEHIRYVLSSMKQNTTQIRNMKKYLLAVLFNAPATIDNYYSSQVSHDLRGMK